MYWSSFLHRLHRSLLLLLLALLLIGCARSTSSAPAQIQATNTSFPTASPTRSPSATPTLLPPTATPSILPTANLGDLPLPNLPDLSGSPSDYRFATPAPDQLLALMTAVRQQQFLVNRYDASGNQDQKEAERWNRLAESVSVEVRAFTGAVEGAFLQTYPMALPDPAIVFQDPYPAWWTDFLYLRPYPPRYVAGGLISQLNQGGQQVEAEKTVNFSNFSLQPYPAELDGTPGREWIFFIWTPRMDSRYNGFGLWQALDELPGPTYAPLGEPILARPFFYPETYEVVDLTGDGRTDLITIGSGAGFGMIRKDLIAYQWTSAGFKQMSYITHWEDMIAEDFAAEPYIKFFPPTPPALRVASDANHAWSCVYKKVEVYRWPGGIEQRSETNTMNPDAPECLLAHATQFSASDRLDFNTTQSLLERALAGFDPHEPKDQPKIAFAHYHLAILEATRGNDTAARLHLRNMRQGFLTDAPSAKYLDEKLVPLLAEPKLKPIDLCSLGFTAPKEVFSTWWSGLDYPFYIGGPQPDDICSPYDLVNRIMEVLPIDLKDSPEALLKSAGLEVQSIQSLQFPGLKQPVWLAVIKERPDYWPVIGLIPTQKGMQWTRLDNFYKANGSLLQLNEDVTGDGSMDIALAYPSGEEGRCEGDEQAYEVFIAGRLLPNQNVYMSSAVDLCQASTQPLDLKGLMADRNGDGLSDRLLQELERLSNGILEMPGWPTDTSVWYTNSDIFKKFDTLADQENNLLTALYQNGNPAETRARLIDLRQGLLPALPGRNVRQQIDYLIALSYELEGQYGEAVQRYLNLAQETPQTLWSNLAAVKIVRK